MKKQENPKAPDVPKPKVFISYSWSSPAHRDQVREYGDRLLSDGVEVIIDQYDLVEGQDKYHFMEQMATDPSVTNVLVFLDKAYAEKADARKAGVGTESQIMSKEIYDKVGQTKFIPIFCESDPDGNYYVPQFFKTRIGFDFTSAERVNESWEKLIRLLFGKPALVKPAVGKSPGYLDEQALPVSPSGGKLATYKGAVLAGRHGLGLHRREFLNAALEYAESLKKSLDQDEEVLTLLHTTLPLRDQFVDWLELEVGINSDDTALVQLLADFLEQLLPLRYPTSEVSSWSDWWLDAHKIFTYEVFLYLIAILLKTGRYETLGQLLQTSFLLPDEARRNNSLVTYETFYAYSQILGQRNERLNLRRLSPIADLIKERATRRAVPFKAIMQADAVLFVQSLVSENKRWYPQTLVFAEYGVSFPLFQRAAQRKQFEKLSLIFGGGSATDLKAKVSEELPSLRGYSVLHYVDIGELLNVEKWGISE